ncbi:uncharacterized protein LOC130635761 isoform X2 [Hydractinia symbiolongicarpus]|uniref:uncharacterized protein LOC130635761 isoform X2 n=1 Tax=Hydractinia symbiolongicarpus TaxID=13093 RepID=UPI00254D9A8A|nr:uncharacterized protein LOC130635761 isoform X2 [Hydractinia symbiolongicarpus]
MSRYKSYYDIMYILLGVVLLSTIFAQGLQVNNRETEVFIEGEFKQLSWSFSEDVTVKYYYNGSVSNFNNNIESKYSQRRARLIFSNVELSQAGIYTCVGTSKRTQESVNGSISLTVKKSIPPNVTSVFEGITIKAGKSQVFECIATSLPPVITYQWNIGHIQVRNEPRFTEVNGAVFKILNMTKSMEGNYSCTAENSIYQLGHSNTFRITFKEDIVGPIHNLMSMAVVGFESSQHLLNWSVPMDLNENLESELQYSVRYCNASYCENKVTDVTEMLLMDLQPDMEYNFTVAALDKNLKAGHSVSDTFKTLLCTSMQLKCQSNDMCFPRNASCNGVVDCLDQSDEMSLFGCKPPMGAVNISIETQSATSIRVKFTKLPSTEHVTKYDLVLSDGTTKREKNISESEIPSVDFSSLQSFTMYTISITPVNLAGRGNSSYINATTLLAEPDQIRNLKTLFPGRNFITITWTPSNGKLIRKQIIEVKPASTNNVTRIEVMSNVSRYRIFPLIPDTAYQIEVFAVNDAGRGPPRTLNFQKTSKNVCPGSDWYHIPGPPSGICLYVGNNQGNGVTKTQAEHNCMELTNSTVAQLTVLEIPIFNNILRERTMKKAYIGLTYQGNEFVWDNGSPYRLQPVFPLTFEANKACVVFESKQLPPRLLPVDCACGTKDSCNGNAYGYVCKRNEEPFKIKLVTRGWNALTIEWPITSLDGVRPFQVSVNGVIIKNVAENMANVTGLDENTTYAIQVRENFMGFGPWFETAMLKTRTFVTPSMPQNISIMVTYMNNISTVKISWQLGMLGDSQKENVYLLVNVTTVAGDAVRSLKTMKNPVVLSDMMLRKNYSYNLQFFDNVEKRYSDVVMGQFEIREGEKIGPVMNLTHFVVLSYESEHQKLSWSPPNKSSTMFQYKVTYCIYKNVTTNMYCEDVITNKTMITLTNLTSSTKYVYYVEAMTMEGSVSEKATGSFTTLLCNSNEFKCNTGKTCISREKLCDRVSDCLDSFDEMYMYAKCNHTSAVQNLTTSPILNMESTAQHIMWNAPIILNKNSILTLTFFVRYCEINMTQMMRCQNVSVVGKTEVNVTGLTPGRMYWYSVKVVTPRNESSVAANSSFSTLLCNSLQWQCTSGSVSCVAKNQLCNKNLDCQDGSDEMEMANCKKPMPINFMLMPFSESIYVSWDAPAQNERITGYGLMYTDGNMTSNVSVPYNYTSHTIRGLKRNTTYHVTLYAMNPSGQSNTTTKYKTTKFCNDTEFQCMDFSCLALNKTCNKVADCAKNEDELHSVANCSLPAPLQFTIQPAYDGFDLMIVKPTEDVLRVKLIIYGVMMELVSLNMNELNTTISRRNSSLFLPGMMYSIQARSISLAGNGSSTKMNFTTLGPIVKKVVSFVGSTLQSIVIKLEGTAGASSTLVSYQIEILNGSTKTILNVSAVGISEYEIRNLNHSTTYKIRYRAEDGDGYSVYSDFGEYATQRLEKPPPVTGLKLGRISWNFFDISWILSTGDLIQKQIIYYSDEFNQTVSIELNKNVTSYRLHSLKQNTTYFVELVAVNDAGRSIKENLGLTTTDPNLCPGFDWKYFNQSCYHVDDNSGKGASYAMARQYCMMLNTTLASITTPKTIVTLQIFMSILFKDRSLYIGLTQNGSTFAWEDGSTNFNAVFSSNLTSPSNGSRCGTLHQTNIKTFSDVTMVDCACGEITQCDKMVYGFACGRKDVALKPVQISLEGVGWNSLNISWPKTNVLNNRPFEVEVNGRSFNVIGASTPLLGLMEQTNYSVRVREIFNGLSPWSEIAQFGTRSFVFPDAPTNSTAELVQFKESSMVKVSWMKGALGDSEILYAEVNITETESKKHVVSKKTHLTMLSIPKLTPNTNYTYIIQFHDTINNRRSGAVNGTFKTNEKDNCRETEFFCVGSTHCVNKSLRCDNILHCMNGADELLVANCEVPAKVNITNVVAGFDFIVITWLDRTTADRIRNYTLQLDNETMITVSNVTMYRFSNLMNATTYNVSITATNPTGVSMATYERATTAGSRERTGPVSMLDNTPALKYEDTRRAISWKLPTMLNNNDENQLTYIVKWCRYINYTLCQMRNTTNLELTIKGLMPNTSYWFNVIVHNEYMLLSDAVNGMFNTSLCPSTQWSCASMMQCVNLTLLCNGQFDCSDGSDEKSVANCKPPSKVMLTQQLDGSNFLWISYKRLNMSERVTSYMFVLRAPNNTVIYNETFIPTMKDNRVEILGLEEQTYYNASITVANPTGETTSTAKFQTVNISMPGLVRNITSKATRYKESSSVMLNWERPINTGGRLPSLLNYHTIYCPYASKQDASKCLMKNISMGVTSLVLEGLQPNTKYMINISVCGGPTYYGDAISFMFTTLERDTCHSGQHRCPVICVDQSRVCDNIIDCSDNSDESKVANCVVPMAVSNIALSQSRSFWNALFISWANPGLPQSDEVNSVVLPSVFTYAAEIVCNNTQTKRVEGINKTNVFFDDLPATISTPVNCTVSVAAQNLIGLGPVASVTITTPIIGLPSQVTSLREAPVFGWEKTQRKLTWKTPSDLGNARASEITYSVYWCASVDNAVTNCSKAVPVNGTSFIITNLTANVEYQYFVYPVNLRGLNGSFSSSAAFTTNTTDSLPSAPVDLNAKQHSNDPEEMVVLAWKPPQILPGLNADMVTYKILYCKAELTCTDFVTVKKTEHTIGNLDDDTKYRFEVSALNGRGDGQGPPASVEITTQKANLENWKVVLIVLGALVLILLCIIAVCYWHRSSSKTKASYNTHNESQTNKGYDEENSV